MSGVSVHGALHPVMTGKAAGNVAGELDSRERPATWQEMWMYQVQLAWKLKVRLLRLPEQNNAIQFCDIRARLEVNLEDCWLAGEDRRHAGNRCVHWKRVQKSVQLRRPAPVAGKSQSNKNSKKSQGRSRPRVQPESSRCDTVIIQLKHSKRSNGVVMGCFYYDQNPKGVITHAVC